MNTNTQQTISTSSTSSSTYTYTPSTAAASISSLLYLAEVYSDSMQMATEQMQNELQAELSFAKTGAKELQKQGEDELWAALASGGGTMLGGAAQAFGASRMNDVVNETPEEAPNKTPERSIDISDEEGIELQDMSRRPQASEQDIQEHDELKTEEELKNKKTDSKKTTHAQDTKQSLQYRALGQGLQGFGEALAGLPRYDEKLHQMAQKLQEYGQSSSDKMFSQYLQEMNTMVSDLTQLYGSITQIAQANNSR